MRTHARTSTHPIFGVKLHARSIRWTGAKRASLLSQSAPSPLSDKHFSRLGPCREQRERERERERRGAFDLYPGSLRVELANVYTRESSELLRNRRYALFCTCDVLESCCLRGFC